MKKIIKVTGYLILCFLLIGVGVYLYIFREQQINILLIPNEFTYCGKQIYGNNADYKEIVSWLNNNKNGWVTSYVSFIPKQTYKSASFQVNILDNAVVVAYKTDYGYPQFIKRTDHRMSKKCIKQLTTK